MHNKSIYKLLLLIGTIALLTSCDKDFNQIGSEVIGDDHFGLIKDDSQTVLAYNIATGQVETSNQPINSLGYYNNPFFGKTKASVVTQVLLDTVNPTIGTNPTVTKVELSLPYFSRLISRDATSGDSTYELDSIQGFNVVNDKKVFNKIKLSIYENNYTLRDLDASLNFLDVQRYYSGETSVFDTYKNPIRLNDDSNLSQNDEFIYSSAEIKTYKTVDGAQVVDTRSVPGMRIKLRNDFFQNKLFGTGAAGKLFNNSIFKDYFRGLYFKVDASPASPNQGSMSLLNFKQGKIIVTYNITVTSSSGVVSTKERKFAISLGGNSVNLLENDYSNEYNSGLASNSNATTGAYNLFPKGGEGSMSIIKLFGDQDVRGYSSTGTPTVGPNGIPDELDDLRNPSDGKKILVNEANLTFYVDKDKMTGAAEPNRIYLYDLNNHRPIIDYYTDYSVSQNSKNNKFVFGGLIEKDAATSAYNKRGIKYKIRLTNHMINLISKDSTNVRLGLVVTESIGIASNSKLRSATSVTNPFNKYPTAAIYNPLGTVLFGNNIPSTDPNYAKRLKLEIYYTKPN
ncbi:MAG: DUF4270 domain-containing protein [Flavobacteriaceae bacterium]|jgi:hypothetical protein|nr:DUF4270 domain-containing protein [Flavobacteriaceae bacterium]